MILTMEYICVREYFIHYPVKFGRCIVELERIYGIKQGNNQYSSFPQNAEPSKSQEDLASEFGISVDTLNRYKQLADLIPEVEDFLDTGMGVWIDDFFHI